MGGLMAVTDKDLHRSLDSIARTPDGRDLYLYLQKVLCGIPTGVTSDCALQSDHGRRRFASELMGLMAKGIEESDGHFGSRAIVFSVAGGVRTGRAGGAGRRVTLDTNVPGWDDRES